MKHLLFALISILFFVALLLFLYVDFEHVSFIRTEGSKQDDSSLYIDNLDQQDGQEEQFDASIFVPVVDRKPYNNELQNYMQSQVKMNDRMITLSADHIHDEYVSGKVESQIGFRYGTFSFRVNKINEYGLFPAIWMLPVNSNEDIEIDIFESIGREGNRFYGVHHWVDQDVKLRDYFKFWYPDSTKSTSDIITFEWTKDKMEWFYGGKSIYKMEEHIPQVPVYMIMNLAVGGTWSHNPDDSTKFPTDFNIEIVEFKPLEVIER